MSRSLAEVIARRDVLYMLTWREILVKYKQSIMGMLWAILMPTVIVGAGIVVRYGFAVVSGRSFTLGDVASVSVRAVPWAFFVSSIRFCSTSLISNNSLVTKIYLPREIFPIAAMLSQLIDFAVASAALVLLLIIARVGISVQLLWIPVLLAILILLTTGLGILLSAASLFFRDVKYLVEVFLTFAIFFTPVLYEASMLGRWQSVMMLNPVAPLMEGFADVVVRHAPPPLPWVGYSAAVSIVVLVAALWTFRRVEPYFAESV